MASITCKRAFTLLNIWIFSVSTTLGYDTVYIEDFCTTNETFPVVLGSANANSSGILKISRNSTFLENRNCTAYITPPLGFGVVLSLRKVNIGPFQEPQCKNYIMVHAEDKDVTLCGYSDDITEYLAYYSTGPLKLFFHTDNGGPFSNSDATFVITSFQTSVYDCPSSLFQCHNHRCIWKGLTCDGHNNCGDQSDESLDNPANCRKFPAGAIVGIVMGTLSGLLLFIVIPICWCRKRSKQRQDNGCDETTQIISNPPQTDNQQTNKRELNPSTASDSQAQRHSGGAINSNYEGKRYQDQPPQYQP